MTSLTEFFYPLPARRRTAGAVFQWWEQRRFAYNLIVGAAGCATIALSTLIEALPGAFGPPPLARLLGGAVVYGILANLFYFFGPLTELGMYRLWGDQAPRAGPVLFRQGLLFSIGLTLFPIVLVGLGWMARVVGHLFG